MDRRLSLAVLVLGLGHGGLEALQRTGLHETKGRTQRSFVQEIFGRRETRKGTKNGRQRSRRTVNVPVQVGRLQKTRNPFRAEAGTKRPNQDTIKSIYLMQMIWNFFLGFFLLFPKTLRE